MILTRMRVNLIWAAILIILVSQSLATTSSPMCTPRQSRIKFPQCKPKKRASSASSSSSPSTTTTTTSTDVAVVVVAAAVSQAQPVTSRDTDVNYASSDCSASVLASTAGCKGAANVLTAPTDSYMVLPCTTPLPEPLSITIRLCEEVGIEEVHLANHEFFSSAFRRVSLYGAQSFVPVGDPAWQRLGTWEALNKRGPQALSLNETRWFLFLRVEFQSFYPSEEPVCPLTSVKVYGKSGVQDLKAKMLDADNKDTSVSQRDKSNSSSTADGQAAASASPTRRFAMISNTSVTGWDSWWHPPLVLPLFNEPPKVSPAGHKEQQAGSSASSSSSSRTSSSSSSSSSLSQKQDTTEATQSSAFGVLLVRLKKLEEQNAAQVEREQTLRSQVNKMRRGHAKLLRRVTRLEKELTRFKKKKVKWFS